MYVHQIKGSKLHRKYIFCMDLLSKETVNRPSTNLAHDCESMYIWSMAICQCHPPFTAQNVCFFIELTHDFLKNQTKEQHLRLYNPTR